jgi:hypothetical protein
MQTIEEAQVALQEMVAEHATTGRHTPEQTLRVEAQALKDRLNHLEAQEHRHAPGLTLSAVPHWRRLVAKLILKALLVEHGTTFHVWLFDMLETF